MEAGVTGATGKNAVKRVELEYVSGTDAVTLQVPSSEVATVEASSTSDVRVNWPTVKVSSNFYAL